MYDLDGRRRNQSWPICDTEDFSGCAETVDVRSASVAIRMSTLVPGVRSMNIS